MLQGAAGFPAIPQRRDGICGAMTTSRAQRRREAQRADGTPEGVRTEEAALAPLRPHFVEDGCQKNTHHPNDEDH